MMAAPEERKAIRKDPARSAQLVTVGDRLFRSSNVKKAEERYLQAARHDPGSATPLVRLAQVALVREQYGEAARRIRDAERAQPGWIVTAPDIQALYGEPSDFARHLARLESHLQVHPEDRDAWLVLGAQWYLSGRTARAADVFLRLNDPKRQPDIALAAFLQATKQE
jgi:cytochrome c-type biogenesis protein CcmH/NrfG